MKDHISDTGKMVRARDVIAAHMPTPGGFLESSRKIMRETRADRVLAALSKMPLPDRLALACALVAGDGFVVVPREPTEAMLAACKGSVRAHNRSLRKAGILESGEYISPRHSPAILYRAMIAATEAPDGP